MLAKFCRLPALARETMSSDVLPYLAGKGKVPMHFELAIPTIFFPSIRQSKETFLWQNQSSLTPFARRLAA